MNVIAYVDEAGAKGYSRNLEAGRDEEVGLLCALLVPTERIDELRERFRPGFDAFCTAAPDGEKHHITDAFRPGNEGWGAVAHEVRSEFQSLVLQYTLPVVFDARRLAVQRQSHEATETLKAASHAARRNRKIKTPARPDTRRVETQLIEGLTLKLDAMAEDFGWDRIDLWFDEIDKTLADHYRTRIQALRSLSSSEVVVKGWDIEAKAPVSASAHINIRAPFPIDVCRVGDVEVVGKSDPLVLAADFVANSLHHHLRGLDVVSPLNAPSSIEGWPMAERVYGVRDDAFEDLI